jgi:hypothetical protein
MGPRTFAGIARLYLRLAAVGYIIIGVGLGAGGPHNDGSPVPFFLTGVGSFTAPIPYLMIAVCKKLITSPWANCASNAAFGMGLLTLASVQLIRRIPCLVYILYAITAVALISAILNAPTERDEVLSFMISVGNASAFFLATREIHHARATEVSVT